MFTRILFLFLILSQLAFAQSKLSENELAYFKKNETELLQLSKKILNEAKEADRIAANVAFISLLQTTLEQPNALHYAFDSLTTISILNSHDKKVKIFNWELKHNNNNYEYFGCILYTPKPNENTLLFWLSDKSSEIKRPENASLTNENWYGAHYYKLVENKTKKKTYYYLLGLDWNNSLSRKKIIDVLYFTKDKQVRFGENLFKVKNQSYRRYIMEYSAEISASLKFHEKENAFVMDNLVPKNENLKGQYQFYGPDMTYNAFILKKGKLTLKEDYDARNSKSTNDKLYNDPTKNTVNPTDLQKK